MLARSGAVVLGIAVLVGIWGGFVPFIGPLFGYRMGSEGAWVVTESRVTLHVLPAVAVVVGGLLALAGRARAMSWAGASLVLLGGGWFIIGPILRPVWAGEGGMMMMGSAFEQFLRQLGYHYGTGLVVAGLAAFALGRMAAAPAVERAVARERRRVARPEPARTASLQASRGGDVTPTG